MYSISDRFIVVMLYIDRSTYDVRTAENRVCEIVTTPPQSPSLCRSLDLVFFFFFSLFHADDRFSFPFFSILQCLLCKYL